MRVLGVGTFGVVNLARHLPTGRSLAVKCISKEFVLRMRQRKHIVRERAVHLQMDHPFVVTLHCTYQDADHLYLVMDYLPGGELWSAVYSRTSVLTRGCGGLALTDARFYLACLTCTLDYIHNTKRTIFRDLKLENIVLDAVGYPHLLDFGFAKPFDENNSDKVGTLCGSLDYMAPEMVLRKPYDHRADFWSFGVIMFELLTGSTPFCAENRPEQSEKIIHGEIVFPDAFQEEYPTAHSLICSLLAKDPDDRLSSCSQLRKHPFFEGYYDWTKLLNKSYPSPFQPQLSDEFDSSMFNPIDDPPLNQYEPYDVVSWFDEF